MSRWTDPQLAIEPEIHPDGTCDWVVVHELVWEVGFLGSQFEIRVPVGFTTDLGSIPWWLRWLLSGHDPQCVKAYVLHDFILLPANRAAGWSSQFALSQLYDALRADGVPAWSRVVHFFGVAFGIARAEW